jgi:hypothetical protein
MLEQAYDRNRSLITTIDTVGEMVLPNKALHKRTAADFSLARL